MKNYINRKISLLLTFVMVTMLFVGCSAKDKTTTATTDATTETTTTQEATTVAAVVVVDPMAKYEEPITVTSFFEIAPPIASIFTEDRINNNVFAKQYLAELGINIKYEWYATQSQEDSVQKKNVAIASGEIPDIMMVNKEQLALLSKSGLINTDMGTIFEQYASEHLKEWIYQEGDAAMLSATYGGKVIAIPAIGSAMDTAPFLWIRQDWVEKLGLQMPKTMDDLYNIMVAFKNNDPDGNGKADTVGLILNKDFLTMSSADAVGLFNGFGAYPDSWVKGADGKLAYGSVLPEVKDALAFLAKLYAEGLIEEDFSAKDVPKVAELPPSGTAGIQYGAMWNAMWPLQGSKDNDPTANWLGVSIVSNGTEPAHPQIHMDILNYYVVNAKSEHPEAVVKLLNFFVEKFGYTTGAEYDTYLTKDNGPASFAIHETMFKTYNAMKNLNAYKNVNAAFDSKDTSKLTAEELSYYDSIVKYQAGDNSLAGSVKTFGKEGSYAAMDYYYTNKLFMMDEFYGAPTDTMKQKMQLIKDKTMEYFTKVIMGVDTVDNFDKFVAEVNKLGLDQITQEVNDWAANR